jgi:hypothetical protein
MQPCPSPRGSTWHPQGTSPEAIAAKRTLNTSHLESLGAERAGIAQAVELQRRRPQRQHAGAAVVGVAHQINRHVDAIGADGLMAERWPIRHRSPGRF